MRKLDAYVAILSAIDSAKIDAEAFDIFKADVEKMREKDKAAKAESAEKAAARKEVLNAVVEIMKSKGEAMLCKDIVPLLDGDYTPQKLSYVLKEGVTLGVLDRKEEGRSVYYSLK